MLRIIYPESNRNNTLRQLLTSDVFILDNIISELETKFNPFFQRASKLSFLFPEVMVTDEVSIHDSTLQEVIDFYSSDILDTYHLQQKLCLRR